MNTLEKEHSTISVRRLLTSSGLNVFFLAVQSVVFLLMTPLAYRVLDKDLFGFWTIMLSIMGVSNVANFKAVTTTMKFVSQYHGNRADSANLSAVVTMTYALVGLSAIVLTFAFVFTRFYWAEALRSADVALDTMAASLGLLSLAVVPLLLSEVSSGILLGLLKNGINGLIVTTHHVFLWAGAYLVGIMKGGVLELSLVILVVNFSRFALLTLSAWFFLRGDRLGFVWSPVVGRQLVSYSFTNWLGSIGLLLFNTADRIIVGMVIGPSAAGVYGIGVSIALRLSMLSDQLTQVLVPFSSISGQAGRLTQIAAVFRQSSRAVAVLITFLAGIILIWMEVLLAVWISPEFSVLYSDLFRSLILAYGIYSMFRPAYQMLQGLGWLFVPSVLMLVCAVLMLVAVDNFSTLFGLPGAVFSNFIFIFLLGINAYLAARLGLPPISAVLNDVGFPVLAMIGIYYLPYQIMNRAWLGAATSLLILLVLFEAFRLGQAQKIFQFVRSTVFEKAGN